MEELRLREDHVLPKTSELGNSRETGVASTIVYDRAFEDERAAEAQKAWAHPPKVQEEPDLEIQVQDVMLMEVMHTLADLLGEQDYIQFR